MPCFDCSPLCWFLAVAVPETGIDPQRDLTPWSGVTQLIEHVRRAAVDRYAALDDQSQGRAVKDIGRIHDFRRLLAELVARRTSLGGSRPR